MTSNYTTPIYLINLDRSPERLAAFDAGLKKHALAFTRIQGIVFTQLTKKRQEEVYADLKFPAIKHALTAPEIGCYLSHYEVWKVIAKGNAPIAIVFEDDARIADNFLSVLQHVETTKPDWDILRLYSHSRKTPLQSEKFIENHMMLTVENTTMSTVAYIITKEAAQHLSEIALPVNLPVDAFLKRWWMHGLCSKQIWPSVAFPSSEAEESSTIATQRSAGRAINPIVRLWRNARYQFYLKSQRKKHISALPRTRQFF